MRAVAIPALFHPGRAFSRELGRGLVLSLTGAAVGALAWREPAALALLLALPLLAACASLRWQVFALMLGYFGVGSAALPSIIRVFFEVPRLSMTFGAPIALASLLATPFLLFKPTASPWKRSAGYAAALLVFTVPPVGMFAWMNPLMLAGTLFPHTGLTGVVGCWLLMAALAGMGHTKKKPVVLYVSCAILAAISALAISHYGYRPDHINESLDYAAVDMALSPATTAHAQTRRTETAVRAMQEATALPWSKIIVLPESAVSPYRSVDEIMLFPPSNEARRMGKAIVFGAVILGDEHTWRDVVMGAGTLAKADGTPRILDEPRLLMPMGNWHLGFPGGATPRPFSTDRGEIAGRVIAWSICYEDAVLWPHWFLLTGNPTAMLSLDNDWALRNTFPERVQIISAEQLARMAGVPLISARNR